LAFPQVVFFLVVTQNRHPFFWFQAGGQWGGALCPRFVGTSFFFLFLCGLDSLPSPTLWLGVTAGGPLVSQVGPPAGFSPVLFGVFTPPPLVPPFRQFFLFFGKRSPVVLFFTCFWFCFFCSLSLVGFFFFWEPRSFFVGLRVFPPPLYTLCPPPFFLPVACFPLRCVHWFFFGFLFFSLFPPPLWFLLPSPPFF